MDEALQHAANKIFADTYTKVDSYAKLLLLEDILEKQIYGGHENDADLARRIREEYPGGADHEQAQAVAAWGSEVIGAFSRSDLHERIEEVKKHIEGAPELVVYAPVAFGLEALRALGGWCRANIDPNVFLEMRVDPGVIGGCSFVWRDKLYDFSLALRMRAHTKEMAARIESYLSAAV
ncbi:MAG: hypothetical protein ACREGH_01020 [Minisyncoccia bacterium]